MPLLIGSVIIIPRPIDNIIIINHLILGSPAIIGYPLALPGDAVVEVPLLIGMLPIHELPSPPQQTQQSLLVRATVERFQVYLF